MPGLEWGQILPYLFGFMALAIIGWFAGSIRKLDDTANRIWKEMAKMNTQLAVIISRVDSHEVRLSRLEDRE